MGFKAGTTNLYQYVGDNPATILDPSGLQGIVQGAPGHHMDPANPNSTNYNPETARRMGWGRQPFDFESLHKRRAQDYAMLKGHFDAVYLKQTGRLPDEAVREEFYLLLKSLVDAAHNVPIQTERTGFFKGGHCHYWQKEFYNRAAKLPGLRAGKNERMGTEALVSEWVVVEKMGWLRASQGEGPDFPKDPEVWKRTPDHVGIRLTFRDGSVIYLDDTQATNGIRPGSQHFFVIPKDVLKNNAGVPIETQTPLVAPFQWAK